MAGVDASAHGRLSRLGHINSHHGRDRSHHLAGLLLVEMKDAGEHVRLTEVDLSARVRLGDDPLELVGGATLGLGVGIGAEHAQQRA
jgi:hypothetical protein